MHTRYTHSTPDRILIHKSFSQTQDTSHALCTQYTGNDTRRGRTMHNALQPRFAASHIKNATTTNAPHYTALHHTATHCTTLHHTAPHCTTLHHTAPHCATLHHTAPHCTTLHHTATNCNTPQHRATARTHNAQHMDT